MVLNVIYYGHDFDIVLYVSSVLPELIFHVELGHVKYN